MYCSAAYCCSRRLYVPRRPRRAASPPWPPPPRGWIGEAGWSTASSARRWRRGGDGKGDDGWEDGEMGGRVGWHRRLPWWLWRRRWRRRPQWRRRQCRLAQPHRVGRVGADTGRGRRQGRLAKVSAGNRASLLQRWTRGQRVAARWGRRAHLGMFLERMSAGATAGAAGGGAGALLLSTVAPLVALVTTGRGVDSPGGRG